LPVARLSCFEKSFGSERIVILEPLTGRARVPARRESVLEASSVFSVLDQGRLWASATTDREDAIPPSAGSGGCPAAAGPIPKGATTYGRGDTPSRLNTP
jgi:hypothetical protein